MRLTPELLLAGYLRGIFPMASDRIGEISWFRPEQRGILPLNSLRIPRNLRKLVRSGRLHATYNRDFAAVIHQCAVTREETWISAEIERAYEELHRSGFAHSVEIWSDGDLVGGLYGVSIAGAFFGESMFHLRRDASKVALVYLVSRLRDRGFSLLDTQYVNPHLISLGGIEIDAAEYEQRLAYALSLSTSFCDGKRESGEMPPIPSLIAT